MYDRLWASAIEEIRERLRLEGGATAPAAGGAAAPASSAAPGAAGTPAAPAPAAA
jgi:hypothetical protein